MTIWKEVESKGIKWLISTNGEVKTPAHETAYTRERNGKTQTFSAKFKERKLTPCLAKNGYLEVAAMKSGKRIKHLLHRLIAMAFVDGYSPELTVNHVDGNKTNNSIENLEWVSLARNSQHQWESGLVNLRGENHPCSKLTSKQVVYIRRLLSDGIPGHALAVIAGVSPSAIDMIKNGNRWKNID